MRELLGSGRDLRISVIFGIVCLLIYNSNGRAISAGDAYPARYQPFAICKYQTLFLDRIEVVTSQGRVPPTNWQNPQPNSAFWIVPIRDGHLISLYSVVLPVMIAPLYLPAAIYIQQRGWTNERVDRAARIMEKFVASFLAALSASLLYLVLRRRALPSTAILLTAAYAFGTTTWVIGSQALWQHGMGELLVVGLILLLTAPCTAPRALAAGLLCGLIAGNRPADAVLAIALGMYGLFWANRRAPLVVMTAMLPILAVLFYNVSVVGALSGAYQVVGSVHFFHHAIGSGLAGLLFSPTRGLFIFSPFLLFVVFAGKGVSGVRDRGLNLAILAGICLQILLYSKTDWRGGIAWGPRFLTDLLPLLIWLLVPAVGALTSFGRACFAAAVAIAIVIECIGAFAYTGVTDLPIYADEHGAHKLRPAWNWRNAGFVASLSRGLAPAELMSTMRGRIDFLEANGRATDALVPGEDAVATGWALAGLSTPMQVGISIDGGQLTAVQTFRDRPDVRGLLPGAAPSGWRIPLKTATLEPGVHRLSLFLWASQRGDTYLLTSRELTVNALSRAGAKSTAVPGEGEQNGTWDREASIRTATSRIRANQQTPGYWLTAFTPTTQFVTPHNELNTYLAPLLIDLLSAVAPDLRESLQRARQFLTTQIEANGLVRYHGLPNAPTIGRLGCVITPDTDDTALVWRVAPGRDRTLLSTALGVINGYRTREGLYRTWLAPRHAYQCLDPGTDPNPVDIGIQMHLLQLLQVERPSEARSLCEALRRHVDDDQIWIYYRLSPLIPILRSRDVKQGGCDIQLPPSRIRASVPGQDVWVSLVERLSSKGPQGDLESAQSTTMLRQIAQDDFAFVRNNPPLLYHNDLTATVPRYYWSQDAGYALWLRLIWMSRR